MIQKISCRITTSTRVKKKKNKLYHVMPKSIRWSVRMRGGFRGGSRGGSHGGRQDYGRSSGQNVECGTFLYLCEDKAVFKLSTSDKLVPPTKTYLFDAQGNKLGIVDDVFGPTTDVKFTLAADSQNTIQKFKENDKIYAPQERLKTESFFASTQNQRRGGRGGGRGAPRGGGRGAPRGGSRGGPRGGSFSRGRGGFRGGR